MAKCGYVALIGRPNAGKSTLLNRLIGQKVSIVSDKPQTTRHRIQGVLTRDDSQMIFVDTPGIHRPGYRLNQRMMEAVFTTLKDVDVVLHLVDATRPYGKGEQFVVDMLKKTTGRALLLLNKVDLVNKGKLLPKIDAFKDRFEYGGIIPISALRGDNQDALVGEILKLLPEGSFFYPPEYFTDQQERTLTSEIIREKVLHHTRQELPYSTAVTIESFDEDQREEGLVRIAASIIVDKPSQKKIVIGRAGRMIKAIGTDARKELLGFLQTKRIYLELNVKVVPGWRDQVRVLDELGVR